MEIIKIQFTDFWPGFDKEDNYFYNLLSERYEIIISDNEPDILFYSCYGNGYLGYDCLRIFYIAENMRPDFTACDFAIGFDYLTRENYFRLPLYVLYLNGDLNKLVKKDFDFKSILESKTKFCNMVVSNPYSQRRIHFFEKLSKYKKVDSGGKYLNNVGGPVVNKNEFIRQYKFTLAFENSSYPGYTTEKILEPMLENSLPIYWGNPLVDKEFNKKSFLNHSDYGNDEALIERIIEIDKNDDIYLQYMSEPYYNNNIPNSSIGKNALLVFLEMIIGERTKNPPVAITYKKHLHELKRRSSVISYEVKKFLGIKYFR